MSACMETWPDDWERVVWNNGRGDWVRWRLDGLIPPVDSGVASDLSVYGRYAAIEYASHDLIFVQDDDVIVSDPQAIVDAWCEGHGFPCPGCNGLRSALCSDCEGAARDRTDHVVCNMPQEFRHDFYRDHALVGFGAAFLRRAPRRAFDRWTRHFKAEGLERMLNDPRNNNGAFLYTCDVIFTALTPRVLVDVPKQNLPWATDADRMYRQRDHVAERARMLELALKVRDS